MCSCSTSKAVAVLSVVTALWPGGASATQPAKLGYAESVIGGELVLVEERCTFQGLGTGYALYLTNPRGSTIGKGCAMTNELPPELGMIMVQWGASSVHGAESYQIDGFTWTSRGRVVIAPILKARYEAKARMKAKEEEGAKDEAAATAMVAAFNNPGAEKTYLGVVKTNTYPPTLIITQKQCNRLVMEPDPSGQYSGVMVRKIGRTALGLSTEGDKVVSKGCALPDSELSITVDLGYRDPNHFTGAQISWEPKGQKWIEAENAKGK